MGNWPAGIWSNTPGYILTISTVPGSWKNGNRRRDISLDNGLNCKGTVSYNDFHALQYFVDKVKDKILKLNQ